MCEAVRTNFEDAGCGLVHMHPNGIECSSMEDRNSSSDDETKEIFAELALPAESRVGDVESVEVVVDSTPSTQHGCRCQSLWYKDTTSDNRMSCVSTFPQ